MIDQSTQKLTLKVCLDDAGTHNKAILDFFFAKIGTHIFKCVGSQDEANVILVDYDFPPARARFDEEYSQWGKPALVLSIAEVSLDNAIWLAKPLTSRALLDAAETLQNKIAEQPQESEPKPVVQLPEKSEISLAPVLMQQPSILPLVEKSLKLDSEISIEEESINESIPDVSETDDQSINRKASSQITPEPPQIQQGDNRESHLCGTKNDIDPNTDLSDFYIEDSFFLSSLKDAIRLARQCQQGVLLNFQQARIYVLPEIHRVFCGINIYGDEFSAFINACSASEGGKMHILSTREIHELNEMISQQASALYDMEAFVWSATLLSSQGSLPRALDPNKPAGLKHWPSLTRLENFSHVMPIAAQWSASPMSAFEIARALNIPQRYVFSFYNACHSLGLIEQDPDKLMISKKSVPGTKDAPRGLFSRLLKRLVGG